MQAITSSQQHKQQKKGVKINQDDTINVPHPSSNPINAPPLSSYQNCIGIIRGEWFSYSDTSKLETICYGTAIALSKRVILTCAHTLYLEKKRRICNNISFIINQENGLMKQGEKVYRASSENYIKLQQISLSQTFTKKAIPEDLALVYLNEDLPLQYFPDVGLDISLNSQQVSVHDSLYISGYPSAQYFNKVQLKSISFNRKDLKGTLEGVDANQSILYHNLDTKTGHSGSAIFARNSLTQKPTVIGVHTHKGRLNNSGIVLTEMLLERIASYDLSFAINHPQYDASIKLPLKIRTAAFEDVSRQKQNLIQEKSPNYRFFSQRDTQNSDSWSSMDLFDHEEKEQELIDYNSSTKLNYQILPYYYSIQELRESQQQAITKFTDEQQSTLSKTTNNNNQPQKQNKKYDSSKQKNNLKQTNKQQFSIIQISQYLKMKGIYEEHQFQFNQQLSLQKIECNSQNPQKKNLETWEEFYQFIFCENYSQNYSLRMNEGKHLL